MRSMQFEGNARNMWRLSPKKTALRGIFLFFASKKPPASGDPKLMMSSAVLGCKYGSFKNGNTLSNALSGSRPIGGLVGSGRLWTARLPARDFMDSALKTTFWSGSFWARLSFWSCESSSISCVVFALLSSKLSKTSEFKVLIAESYYAKSIADISPESNGNLNGFVDHRGNEAWPRSAS